MLTWKSIWLYLFTVSTRLLFTVHSLSFQLAKACFQLRYYHDILILYGKLSLWYPHVHEFIHLSQPPITTFEPNIHVYKTLYDYLDIKCLYTFVVLNFLPQNVMHETSLWQCHFIIYSKNTYTWNLQTARKYCREIDLKHTNTRCIERFPYAAHVRVQHFDDYSWHI